MDPLPYHAGTHSETPPFSATNTYHTYPSRGFHCVRWHLTLDGWLGVAYDCLAFFPLYHPNETAVAPFGCGCVYLELVYRNPTLPLYATFWFVERSWLTGLLWWYCAHIHTYCTLPAARFVLSRQT